MGNWQFGSVPKLPFPALALILVFEDEGDGLSAWGADSAQGASCCVPFLVVWAFAGGFGGGAWHSTGVAGSHVPFLVLRAFTGGFDGDAHSREANVVAKCCVPFFVAWLVAAAFSGDLPFADGFLCVSISQCTKQQVWYWWGNFGGRGGDQRVVVEEVLLPLLPNLEVCDMSSADHRGCGSNWQGWERIGLSVLEEPGKNARVYTLPAYELVVWYMTY